MERTSFFRDIIFIFFIVAIAGCGGDGAAPIAQGIPNTGLSQTGGGPVADIPKTLTVTKTGTGSGNILSSPSGIDCGVTCSSVSLHAWVPIATPSPTETLSGRSAHTAVWTGTEMIVWGGWEGTFSHTGAKYNPATNRWTAIAPPPSSVTSGRDRHSAVWTGTEMIVWGGREDGAGSNTGAKYNPTTDTWSTITPPPSAILGARMSHTAVWTGSEMIIWGGFDFGPNAPVNTGAKYNPATDTWTTITPPPFLLSFAGRERHSAVWTGTEMIIWGGIGDDPILPRNLPSNSVFNNGATFNPETNAWTMIDTPSPGILGKRRLHSAVWDGSEMIIWGGFELGISSVKTGARYDPATNSWAAILAPSGFSERGWHSAVSTGTEMIVWGGIDSSNQTFNDGRGFRGGAIVTLTATPDTSSTFDDWSGFEPCVGVGPSCVISVDGDQTIIATFN